MLGSVALQENPVEDSGAVRKENVAVRYVAQGRRGLLGCQKPPQHRTGSVPTPGLSSPPWEQEPVGSSGLHREILGEKLGKRFPQYKGIGERSRRG